ncbi:MAG: hypothetical protein QOF59_2647 [Actinomycetota bacterium]|nr:hypothetical protein [Actinomycetota bacterium]
MNTHPTTRSNTRTRGRTTPHGEEGAALELALLFMIATALIVTVLLGFASTSSRATVVTRAARGTDYDADAAMQAAIATVRVGSCASFTPSFTLNNPTALRVDCNTTGAVVGSQRHLVLSVCPTNVVTVPCPDASSLLRAEVVFFDDGGIVGRAVSVLSWSNQ